VLTAVLGVSAELESLDWLWDSPALGIAASGAAMLLGLGIGRPHASYRVTPIGIERSEGLFFRWPRLGSRIRWEHVAGHGMEDQLDGSRALVIRSAEGRVFRIWERGSSGDTLDSFYSAVRVGVRGRSRAPSEPVTRPIRHARALRAILALLAVLWLAIVIGSVMRPPANLPVRVAALVVQGLLLAGFAVRLSGPSGGGRRSV